MFSFKQKLARHFSEVARMKLSPHAIALGFALGTFIAILPTFGFAVIIGVIIVFLNKRINKIALFAGIALWNPLTLIPIYYLSYRMGDVLLGAAPVVEVELTIIDQLYLFSKRLLMGQVVFAVIISVISYVVVKRIAAAIEK